MFYKAFSDLSILPKDFRQTNTEQFHDGGLNLKSSLSFSYVGILIHWQNTGELVRKLPSPPCSRSGLVSYGRPEVSPTSYYNLLNLIENMAVVVTSKQAPIFIHVTQRAKVENCLFEKFVNFTQTR